MLIALSVLAGILLLVAAGLCAFHAARSPENVCVDEKLLRATAPGKFARRTIYLDADSPAGRAFLTTLLSTIASS